MALAYPNPSSSCTSDDIELPRHDGPFEPRALQDEEQIDPWEEGLETFHMFALTVNKMIGNGIYTAPTAFYLMTGSKSLTLVLFCVGVLYCLMAGSAYDGGELVYLDEITAHVTPTSTDTSVVPVPQEHNEGLNEAYGRWPVSEALQLQGDNKGAQNSWARLYEAVMIVTILFYTLLNLVILIINTIPEYVSSDGTEHVFPGYGFPVIVASVIIIGTAYYVLFFGAAYRYYEPLPASSAIKSD
ncbi:Ff.00g011460.m01.CDS01 [Fusarium sp. VM40]|nr:Ff.00g011460.m01.CDS01 [Fusarium sp. VM40]